MCDEEAAGSLIEKGILGGVTFAGLSYTEATTKMNFMAKWADYLISGVWFSQDENTRHVSHLELHVGNDANVGSGEKVSKDQVISIISQGNTVKTIRWNYERRNWSPGAFVEIYHLNGKKYLRSAADASVSDNLDNMLPMGALTG